MTIFNITGTLKNIRQPSSYTVFKQPNCFTHSIQSPISQKLQSGYKFILIISDISKDNLNAIYTLN